MTAWRPGRTGRSTRRSSARPTSRRRRRSALDGSAGRADGRAGAQGAAVLRPAPAPVAPLERWYPTSRRPGILRCRSPWPARMTSDSAWGAVHWGPAHRATGRAVPRPCRPPPTPGPARRTGGHQPLVPAPTAAAHGRFPAPGTPAWFGPGPYGERPAPPGQVGPKAVWTRPRRGCASAWPSAGWSTCSPRCCYAVAWA